MGVIEAKNICKEFCVGGTSIKVLKGIDLSLEEGKLSVLMGPSGSGKTTLINQLSLLDNPSSGELYLFGEDTKELSEKKKDEIRRYKMGLIFQSVALISKMSAYENVDFFLRVAGYPKKEREKRVEECLKLVGLGKRMHHMPYEMSGGEQQRVAIARAISHKPKIIFADEPTAELDSETGLKILKLFTDLIKQENVSIIMSSHDPAVVEIADDIIYLKDGKLEEYHG